jgi:hypothetical protein
MLTVIDRPDGERVPAEDFLPGADLTAEHASRLGPVVLVIGQGGSLPGQIAEQRRPNTTASVNSRRRINVRDHQSKFSSEFTSYGHHPPRRPAILDRGRTRL